MSLSKCRMMAETYLDTQLNQALANARDEEQKKLEAQAYKAKIILSKSGELLTYSQYRQLMAAE